MITPMKIVLTTKRKRSYHADKVYQKSGLAKSVKVFLDLHLVLDFGIKRTFKFW